MATNRMASDATSKDQLKEQVSVVKDDLAEMGHLAKHAASETIHDVKGKTREMLEEKKGQAHEMEDKLLQHVRDRPLQSVAIAAGIGIVLGFLSRR